jgi:hypothetical protein
MNEQEREIFERIARAQEKMAAIAEKQQPGRFMQILAVGAAIVSILGLLNAVDIVVKWLGGTR